MAISADRLAQQLGAPQAGPAAYRWLADRMRALVLDGRLVVGDRVPSERATAAALGLSRTTVTAAFTQLRVEGFLQSRQGSSTVVSLPSAGMDRPDDDLLARGERTRAAAHGSTRGAGGGVNAGGEPIDLTIAALPAPAILGELAQQAAEQLSGYLSGPGLHPLGIRPLRAAIAAHLTGRGLPTSTDQILVTQGALHGWDLVLRSLVKPGDAVLVEQPTYPGVLDAAAAHHARILPMAVSQDGWQMRDRQGPTPSVALVMADFQNPTGLNATRAQRRALLRALPNTVVVVDETIAELALVPPQPPLASLDASGRTITLGTLSKTVWAGLRLGWVRADPLLVRRMSLRRGGQDLATPVLDQLLALGCLQNLDRILPPRLDLLRGRRDHLVEALTVAAPGWTFARPDGGLVLWVDLGAGSSTQLAMDVRSAGVRITPGPRFSATGTHDRFVRIPFTLPEQVLDQAVKALTTAASTKPARGDSRSPQTWTA